MMQKAVALYVTFLAAVFWAASCPLAGSATGTPPNGGFETGDFTGWQVDGTSADVAIVPNDPPSPCFQPDMPSEGVDTNDPLAFMACLSTETFFGSSASGGVRSDLTSDPFIFPFRPGKITVSFMVDFQTEEPVSSIAFNDAFQARLITPVGTFVMLQLDTFGHTTDKGVRVEGFTGLTPTQAACPLVGLRTKRLKVTWSRTLGPSLRRLIGMGPVFIEFSVADQGGPDRTTIACVDDVRLTFRRPQ